MNEVSRVTMRRRTKSSKPARRASKPTAVDEVTVGPKKRVQPPLIEQFHVAVDRQLKSGYGTYEAAEKAALAIKRWHPQLQVTVYDAKERRHTTIERPKAVADPPKKSAHRVRSVTTRRRAVAGGGR